MNSSKQITKKYPAIWLQNRMKKLREMEQNRKRTTLEVDNALNKLMKRYSWDEAYLFGSVVKKRRYRHGSDVDIAISGLNKFDYYAFVGDISELLNKRVDVVLLEECRFRQSIMEKGIRWSPKKK